MRELVKNTKYTFEFEGFKNDFDDILSWLVQNNILEHSGGVNPTYEKICKNFGFSHIVPKHSFPNNSFIYFSVNEKELYDLFGLYLPDMTFLKIKFGRQNKKLALEFKMRFL